MTAKEKTNCLNLNTFNGIKNGSKTIGDPSICHKASQQCCFINITHYYGDYKLVDEYCNILNVNIDEFKKFLYNLYNDDEMFYANFTAYNYEMYGIIGRNLETPLTEQLDCFLGPKTKAEYSTYVDKNCALFQDGICIGAKNTTQFNDFMSKFHSKYSDSYCNKKEDDKKCLLYYSSRSNDKMIKPLLEELRDYLQADSDEYEVVNNESNVDINPETDEDDGANTFLSNWTWNKKFIKACKQRPTVSVDVICPSNYEITTNLKIHLSFILLLICLYIF